MIYEYGELLWNDIDGEIPKNSEKTYPSATLSTTNPTLIDQGMYLGLRGERPATNLQSRSTV
jgi:hypothetical protein